MADKKISALTAATTPLAGTEVLPVVQAGTTNQVTVANLTAARTVGALKYEADYTATAPSLSGSTGTGLRLRASTGLFTVLGADPSTPFSGWLQVSNGAGSSFPLTINPLGGRVGIGTLNPSTAAVLDATSTSGGILFPRMTTAQRDAISTPPDGLVVYNTSTNKLQVRAAGAWVDLH